MRRILIENNAISQRDTINLDIDLENLSGVYICSLRGGGGGAQDRQYDSIPLLYIIIVRGFHVSDLRNHKKSVSVHSHFHYRVPGFVPAHLSNVYPPTAPCQKWLAAAICDLGGSYKI